MKASLNVEIVVVIIGPEDSVSKSTLKYIDSESVVESGSGDLSNFSKLLCVTVHCQLFVKYKQYNIYIH